LVSLYVRNVGVGLAIIDPQHSKLLGWPDSRSAQPNVMMAFESPTITAPVLPPGEEVWIRWVVSLGRWQTDSDTIVGKKGGGLSIGQLTLPVVYTDGTGTNPRSAHVVIDELGPGNPHEWSATRIDYYDSLQSSEVATTVRFY
jgi:hypothetical protein